MCAYAAGRLAQTMVLPVCRIAGTVPGTSLSEWEVKAALTLCCLWPRFDPLWLAEDLVTFDLNGLQSLVIVFHRVEQQLAQGHSTVMDMGGGSSRSLTKAAPTGSNRILSVTTYSNQPFHHCRLTWLCPHMSQRTGAVLSTILSVQTPVQICQWGLVHCTETPALPPSVCASGGRTPAPDSGVQTEGTDLKAWSQTHCTLLGAATANTWL